MVEGGTLTNGPKDKEIDDDAHGLRSERLYRLYMTRKEGRGFASIEDCVGASMQGLGEYIKKSKERFLTAIATEREKKINRKTTE